MTLWLPDSARREAVGECYVCGFPMYSVREAERHVVACAKRHQEELQAQSLRARLPIFDPREWDLELERHYAKVGRRMKAEGRLEMHRHERASG